ncbi:MAG: BTAD domain-containing putative transcriptional regulator [Reyranella sp.]|nr:BTAD domain-containing putative transcriptional regulator [Reyranella sp.]
MAWTIRTFGSLHLTYNGRSYGGRLSLRSRALIAFLALRYGRNVRREEIVNVLWAAEYDKKHQKRLSTLLWRLNHARDSKGKAIRHSVLHVDRNGDIGIEPDSCTWIDLAAFEETFKAIPVDLKDLARYDVALMEKAIDLYRGEILPDMDAEWVTEARNHTRQCYLDMLHILVDYFGREKALDKVIAYADRYLQVDPYFERMHVLLINAHLASGRRSLAVASAKACEHLIVNDLGVALSPETEDVVRALLRVRRNYFQGLTPRPKDSLSRSHSIGQLRNRLWRLVTACEAVLDELKSPRSPGH